MRVYLSILFMVGTALVVIPAGICNVQSPPVDTELLTQSKNLGECQACKLFVESFKKGLERTSRGKYEGGDAAWEEEKLKKSYKRSEMRLIDIQEGLCQEERKHSIQCHHMAEKAEEFIENWWAQNPDTSSDLHTYICIDNLKVCCPAQHYGKDCSPCHGDLSNLCSGNGKCRGDGTRKGNGTCLCDSAYTGDNCSECNTGYYLSYQDENKILCSPCHKSCKGGCRNGSQKDCAVCNDGFMFDTDEGCVDINECDIKGICKDNEFCLNSLGLYTCLDCDKSCDRCHGDGPDMCRKCAKGYSKKGEFCIPDRTEETDMEDRLTYNRKDDL